MVGHSTFLDLTDTPAAYGTAGHLVGLNGTGDGLLFIDPATVGPAVLTDLDDVTITTPAAAQVLQFDGVGWVNSPLAWAEIPDKPATFPPDAHTHPSTEVSDFAEAVDDRVAALLVAGTNVTLTYDDVAGSLTVDASGGSTVAALNDLSDVTITTPAAAQFLRYDGAAWVNTVVAWADIPDKPATFPPGAHTHPWSEVTGRPATVDALPSPVGAAGTVMKAQADGSILWEEGGSVPSVNTQTGTAYTLALADAGDIVEMDNAGANTVTVPDNATVAFDIGTIVSVVQIGAGATTVTAATGVTLNGAAAGSITIEDQHKAVSLYKRGTDAWEVQGAIQVPALALDDLSDVAVTTPAAGHLLQHDGTSWVNVAGGAGSGIDADLLDGQEAAAFAQLAAENTFTAHQKLLGGGYLKNGFLAMPGQGNQDMGMTGLFDRNELTLADKRGTVTANFTGAGTVGSTALAQMVDATGAYGTITATDATTTRIEIVFSLDQTLNLYGVVQWQPFVQYRLSTAPGNNATWYKKITVEVSDDGVTWYKPSGGEWETLDAHADGEGKTGVSGLWIGANGTMTGVVPGNAVNYVRVVLEDRQETASYAFKDSVWITGLGLRHMSAPYARQLLRTDGGEFYGGIYAKGATGGNQGDGTINAKAVYDDGTILCVPIEEAVTGTYDRAEWDDLAPHDGVEHHEEMKARGFDPQSADSYTQELEFNQGIPGYWNKNEWRARLAETKVVEDQDDEGNVVMKAVPVDVSVAERHERALLALDYAALAIRDLTNRVKELEGKVGTTL